MNSSRCDRMPRLGLTLRWTAALLTAVVVHVAVLGLGAVLWQRIGGDPLAAVSWMVAAGTLAAVLAGTIVVPRERRRTAAFVIWMLALSPYLWFLVSHFSVPHLETFGAALNGGMVAYLAIVALARTTQQRSRYEHESITGPLPPPIRKLGLAFLTLFACGMVFIAAENLYSALLFHTVMGRHTEWISYEEHPLQFWWMVFVSFSLLMFVLLAALVRASVTRLARRRQRERETRPPLEDVIRQSIYER
jgi:hypothetical protein